MKIAIVGGGVAGLYAAWHLGKRHEVILFEADDRLGGHADTHRIADENLELYIDSGFIVFNEHHYPLFSQWLGELGVDWETSDMSFGVHEPGTGFCYNASTINRLFCQRRNLVNPRFHRMVLDILKFYRMAPGLLRDLDDDLTLGEWLSASGLGATFGDRHLRPMASALWSAPMGRVDEFPMRHLLAFMDNHAMLEIGSRPQWRTVSGGSRRYVERAAGAPVRIETGTAVRSIRRGANAVDIRTDTSELQADAVIVACHSDQALALLDDPSPTERTVLGAITYQPNETLLHTDDSVLPDRQLARAAWNVRIDGHDHDRCRVSYYMNRLQNIDSDTHYIVSLNHGDAIDPERVLARRQYAHPVFTPAAVRAQRRWHEINGRRRTWFCGAWWGWGFHEDGVRSSRRVIDDLESRHA